MFACTMLVRNILLKNIKLTSHKCFQIFFLKYLTHNLELYIKQKLLKNVIWGSNFKILAKRKVFQKKGKTSAILVCAVSQERWW